LGILSLGLSLEKFIFNSHRAHLEAFHTFIWSNGIQSVSIGIRAQ